MAFLARSLGEFLKKAPPSEDKRLNTPSIPASQPPITPQPKGPLKSALSSLHLSPTASLDAEKTYKQMSQQPESRIFIPPVSLPHLKNLSIDDQNFAFFGDVSTQPIFEHEQTIAPAPSTLLTPGQNKNLFLFSSLKPRPFPFLTGLLNASTFSSFKGQIPTSHTTPLYRPISSMISIPLTHEMKQSLLTPIYNQDRQGDTLKNALRLPLTNPAHQIGLSSLENGAVETLSTSSGLVEPSIKTQSSLASWLYSLMSLFSNAAKTKPLSLTSVESALDRQTLAIRSDFLTTLSTRTQSGPISHLDLLISAALEEDETLEAGNETVATQEELMRGLKQFIQDTMTSSFNPKDTPFPELHSFTARLAGGKKISISVVCGAVQAAHLPTQGQRQRIQALMAEDGDTPTLTQRRLDIEHAGMATERRASAQTGDVLTDNRSVLKKMYDGVKGASSTAYAGVTNAASSTTHYIQDRVNGAIDTSLHTAGEWAANRLQAFTGGVKQGLGMQEASPATEPSRALSLGIEFGQTLRSLGEGAIQGLTAPAALEAAATEAPTTSTISRLREDPLSFGRDMGHMARQLATDLYSGAREGLRGAPTHVEPNAATSSAFSQLLDNPAGLGREMGQMAREVATDLYSGAREGLSGAAPAHVEPNAATSSTLTQLLENPASLGRDMGQMAKQVVTDLYSGAREGLRGAPTPVEPSREPSSIYTQLLENPQELGRNLAHTVRQNAEAFIAGVHTGIQRPTSEGSSIEESTPTAYESLLSQVRNNPKSLGEQIGERVATTTQGFIHGVVKGVKDSLSGAHTQEASSNESSLFTRLQQDPSATGKGVGSALVQTATRYVGSLISTSQESPAPSEGPRGIISEAFSKVLGSLSEAVKAGIKSKASQVLLTGLSYALAQTAAKVSSREAKQQIEEMIQEIEKVKEGRNPIDGLRQRLVAIMNAEGSSLNDTRKILEFHLNGLVHIPVRTPSADKPSTESILKEVLESTPSQGQSENTDYTQEISTQKERLVKNISVLSAAHFANKFVCSRLLTDRQISQIVRGEGENLCMPYISRRFIQEVNGLSINFIRKIAAKVSFFIISRLVSIVMKRFINSAFKKIENAIEEGDSPSSDKHSSIIKGANEFLSVLKGRMKEVRDTNFRTAAPETMIDQQLSNPVFNHGLTTEQIYNKAIKKAAFEVLPPLGWTAALANRINCLPTMARWSLVPLTLPTIGIVYLAESLCNALLKATVQIVVKKSNIIENMISRSASEIGKNNYTHAINKIIYEQLQQIWHSLDSPSDGQAGEIPKKTLAKKEALKEMVLSFSDVLHLNKQIRYADSDPSLLERIQNSLNKLCVDQTAEVIGLLIDKAKDTLLDPQHIKKRESSLLQALNNSLESNEDTSMEDMIALEKEIEELGRNVMNKAIEKVIHSTLINLPREIQQKFTRFVDKLQASTKDFLHKMKDLESLQSIDASSLIMKLSKEVLDLQQRISTDTDIESQKGLFEEFYTRPVAEHLQRLQAALQDGHEELAKDHLSALEQCINKFQEVEHINSAALPVLTQAIEKTARWVAMQAGKELLSEAWSLMRKPYVWKHGVVHRSLLGFIES